MSDTRETVVKLDPEYWERGTDPNRFPFLNILDLVAMLPKGSKAEPLPEVRDKDYHKTQICWPILHRLNISASFLSVSLKFCTYLLHFMRFGYARCQAPRQKGEGSNVARELATSERCVRWLACCKVAKGVLYTGSSDQTARSWVIEFGDCARVYGGHQHTVGCVRFHNGLGTICRLLNYWENWYLDIEIVEGYKN